MKSIKKIAFAVALLMCLGFGLPLIPAMYAFAAEPAGYTEGNEIIVENFKDTGVVGEPYTIVNAEQNSAGEVDVTVKDPYGIAVNVNTGTFTPTISGAYSIIYTVASYSKTLYVNVTNSNDGIQIVYPTNSDRIIPSEIGRPDADETIRINVPNVTVEDKDGKVIDGATVVVERNGVELSKDGSNYYFDVTSETSLGEHTFTFKYVVDSKVLASYKKTMQISSKYDNEYDFTYSYNSSLPTSAVLGVEKTLPSVVGVNSNTKDEIGVYYTVKVEYEKGTSITDVTNDVISVNENGEYVFTANQEGNYTFTYTVKDYKGKTAKVSSSSFQIKDVKDSQDPSPVVVEPYTEISDETYVEAEHKLANNVNISTSPILIYPIYATDNANAFVENNLTLYRVLENSSNDEIFDESKIDADINGKILVFNSDINLADYTDDQEVIKGYKKSQLYIVEDVEIDQDTYTIYYNAKDKAGKENSISYTIRALSDFAYNDEDKPEVTFVENLPSAVFFGEKITFATPTAKDVNTKTTSYVDTRIKVDVKYALYAGDTLLEEKGIDDNDSLLVWNDKTSKYEITVPDTFQTATKLVVIATAENDSGIVGTSEKTVVITNSGDTMATTIESVTIDGLNEDYIQGSEIVLPTIVYNEDLPEYMSYTIEIKHESGSTFTAYDAQKSVVDSVSYKTVTYSGAKFTATKSGSYEISYVTKDAGNNITVKQFTLVVSEDPNSSEIRMIGLPSAINEGKLELGETADLAIPTLTTDLEYSYEVQVISGPTGAEISNYKFTPTAVGTYGLQYVATVVGRAEQIKSKVYTVEVVDTTAPTIGEVYYPNEATTGDFYIQRPDLYDISGIDLENSQIKISSTRSTSTFKLSKLLANGSVKPNGDNSYTILEADGTIKYNIAHNNLLYTIEYSIKDIYGNTATKSYQIKVGDTEMPTLDVPDDMFKESYKFAEFGEDKPLTIDISKITAEDNNELTTSDYTTVEDYIKNNIKIKVENSSTGTELKTTVDGKYVYNIKEVGTYKVTFSLSDVAGNVRTVTRTFTVSEDTTTPMTQEEIIGTVLIVVSVIVLAGVVIYFVVSKKKSK